MIPLALLLASSVVIVAASVAFVIGMRRLVYWTKLDHFFLGEIIVTFAWVLPEYLIAVHALLAEGRLANHGGDPFIAVGAIMGAASANMLVIGILNTVWPGRSDLETGGPGRLLGSAAVMLLVVCVSVIGLGVGRGNGVSLGQLIAGAVVFAVFLACLRLLHPRNPKEKMPEVDLDPPFQPGRGTLPMALATSAFSLIILVYLTPFWVGLAIPWYRSGDDLSHEMRAMLLGSLTIALGMMMAVPDFLVSARDLKEKTADSPTSRLFLSSAALMAFTVAAGMDSDTLWNALATGLFAAFILTIFVVALTLILLLAIPNRLPARWQGLLVTFLTLAGFVFAMCSITF